jgi:hypothetical protein
MIVNQTDTGWELICQPAHALLSLQLAARWKHEPHPPSRWWETLHAVAQHDNGWQEWEQEPKLTEAGTPQNFIHMPPPDAIAQWERGVGRGCHQSRWVGLLISRHATSLYAGRKGEVKALDEFLERQIAQQETWKRELGVSEAEVAESYRLIRFFDWLSLVLCWRRLPDNGSPIALGMGPDGREYNAHRTDSGAVTLDPYPFAESDFTVTVEARVLHQKRFKDVELYQTMFWGVRPTVLEWRIVAP